MSVIEWVVLLQFPKGYAYMELADEKTALMALSMTGVQFKGRTIRVWAFCLTLHACKCQVHVYSKQLSRRCFSGAAAFE